MNFEECGDYVSPKFNPEWVTGTLMSTKLEEIEVVLMEGACVPSRKFPSDAGLDLKSNENWFILPGDVSVVDTGVCVNLPEGFVGYVKLKSRSNYVILAGVVDSGYLGTIKVKIYNPLKETLRIEKGDAIAQLVVQSIELPKVKIVEKFTEETDRGTSGGINGYKSTILNSSIQSIE
jgi:dUTP pyrophosphatase